MSITEKNLNIGPLNWYYREIEPSNSAQNPPVVLLHGLPAHSFIWLETMPLLAEYGYRAIAPDWIGFGLSSKPSLQEFAYTPLAFINALQGFLEQLEIKEFSLVVQGFLASVGVQLALRHPELIHRLVILNSPLVTSATLPWMMRQWGLPLLGEMLTQDPLLVDRTLEKGSGFVISDSRLASYRQPFLKSSAAGRSLTATLRNLQLSASMGEIETGLASFTKPTLLLWGAEDPWLLSEPIRDLVKNPAIRLSLLSEAKHYPQEHWLKELAPTLINFLG